jgi:hypothetical protein
MTRRTRLRETFREPQVRLSLLAAAALIVEAVLAKNVLHVHLDVISQFAALWVFIAYQVSGRSDRAARLAAATAIVLATAGVLVVYAL